MTDSKDAALDAGSNETINPDESQQVNSNIGNPGTRPDNWQGDPAYFQTGKKAGQLKPSAGATKATKSKTFGGLNLDSLAATASSNEPSPEAAVTPDKKALKAEKKIVEAKIAAKLVMRMLDTITNWISSGTYGANFTDIQRKERNKYREQLEEDWQDYLQTLDVPLHPALVAGFGSLLYIQDAFNTPAGKEKAQSIKDKIIAKVAVGLFRKKS